MNKTNRKLTPQEKEEHKRYQELVNEKMPKSKLLNQCLAAFAIGGIICCFGQLIGDIGEAIFSFNENDRGAFTSIVLIFIGALLTGIGVYDKIGSFAGAGSVVPITGFANSIVAPAMEHKREGYVLGVAAQMFSFAGPVLVYGIISSIVIGLFSLLFV